MQTIFVLSQCRDTCDSSEVTFGVFSTYEKAHAAMKREFGVETVPEGELVDLTDSSCFLYSKITEFKHGDDDIYTNWEVEIDPEPLSVDEKERRQGIQHDKQYWSYSFWMLGYKSQAEKDEAYDANFR